MKRSLVLILVSLSASPAAAWVLEECLPEQIAAQERYEREVRSASPGSPLFLPHPYPETRAHLLANLEHAFGEIWKGSERHRISPQDRRLLEAFTKGGYTVEQYRVEDWTYVRCAESIGRTPVFLLVFRDPRGRPIGRVAVHASGHWASASFPSPEVGGTWIEKTDADLGVTTELAIRWRSSVGGEIEDAQWVASNGTIRCDILRPCLAFRAKGESYVVQDGALFRLELEGPAMKTHEVLTFKAVPEAIQALRRQVVPGRRHLVTVGFDRVVFATRVGP